MTARASPAAPEAPWALALEGVGLDSPEGAPILRGIDLAVARGGRLAVVGPSGAGKTSLLRLCNRLDEPTAGVVQVLGRPLAEWPVRELRRQVGLVVQEPRLLGLTVRDNLELPWRLRGAAPDESRLREVMERLALPAELLARHEDALSVGQRQRVALARALVVPPAVLLLDEPTSGADPRTAERVLQTLLRLNGEAGLTLVMATHRLEEARRLGGRLAVLLEGRIRDQGSVEEVLAGRRPADVEAFLHHAPG